MIGVERIETVTGEIEETHTSHLPGRSIKCNPSCAVSTRSRTMNLLVGEVVHSPDSRFGHSFSVVNAHRAPLLTLTYQTAREAELARSVIAALLAQATEAVAHPVRSYG
jgi:hypothetical protein